MAPTCSVIVPTFNEAANVAVLVRELGASLAGWDAEVVFVDDSDDDTPDVIRRTALEADLPVRLLHRPPGQRDGGLGGAVVLGLSTSTSPWCVVMDGDLQHPPELVPALLARGVQDDVDVVVASRYCGGGDAGGLSGRTRHLVSAGCTALTRAMFPRRLRDCSDPMTGFFAVRRDALDLQVLRPRGFKILLEILARTELRVSEEPFVFGRRLAGESKATCTQGLRFVGQLAALRFGRMSRFAAVGALGTVLNLLLMAAALSVGVHYLAAAVLAAEVTMVTNFLLQDRLVFDDLRPARPFRARLLASLGFNNVEALARLPVLALLVEWLLVPDLLAQALTLGVAFLVRFTFVSRVVYRLPTTVRASTAPVPLEAAERV